MTWMMVVAGAAFADPVEQVVDDTLDWVGATDGQRVAVKRAVIEAARDVQRETGADAAALARDLSVAWSAEVVSASDVEQLRERVVDWVDAASSAAAPHVVDAARALTPAQRRALAAHLEDELRRWTLPLGS